MAILEKVNINCHKNSILLSLVAILLLGLSSCTSTKYTSTNFSALAKAGIRLGIDIEEKDDHQLFLNASTWLGTRYRAGGTTRSGVDCSGLTTAMYREVYGVKLSRRSIDQYKKDCYKKTNKYFKLKQGDLVFFKTPSSGRKCGHVGIYLKDNKFIHASNKRGVVIADLRDKYWKKYWLGGGSVYK